MIKKFKKGDRVWVFRYSQYTQSDICEEMVCIECRESTILVKDNYGENLVYDISRAFSNKQECIDHIINSIKVIPYEDRD